MSLPYIRRVYRVPAYRGRVIRYCGDSFRITSADGAYLRVTSLSDGTRGRLHPTYLIEWGDEE